MCSRSDTPPIYPILLVVCRDVVDVDDDEDEDGEGKEGVDGRDGAVAGRQMRFQSLSIQIRSN